MKIGIVIENEHAELMIDLLLREVGMLKAFLEDADLEIKRQNHLLTEKAEIIKMLGHQLKGAPKKRGRPKKVTDVIPPVKRGPGRPKGSKKGKST